MQSSRGWRRTRWVVYGVVLWAVVALIVFDRRLKSSDVPGFVPPNATWYCFAEDLPDFWDAMERNALWQSTRPELLGSARAFELRIARATGIRPTPGRFRLWCGDRLLVGALGNQLGVCARPGVLLRAALAVVRWRSEALAGGIFKRNEVYWAWRDGFFIGSPSLEYVESALQASGPLRRSGARRDEIAFAIASSGGAAPLLQLTLNSGPGLPVAGELHLESRDALCAPRPDAEPPVSSVVFVSCGSSHRLEAVAETLWRRCPPLDPAHEFSPFVHAAADYLARVHDLELPDLDAIGDRPLTLVCAGLASHDFLPIPALAAQVPRLPGETTHPLLPFLAGVSAMDHEWSGQAGVLAPLWGDGLTLCLAQRDNRWVAATTEPLMAELMAVDHQNVPNSDCHLAITVRWEPIAALLRTSAGTWREQELVPGANAETVRRWLQTATEVLESVGETRIEGRFSAESLRFEGRLAALPEPVS